MEDDSGIRILLAVVTQSDASDAPIVFNLFLLGILIIVNAFFSAAEIAVITLNDNKVRRDAQKGGRIAQKLLKLIEEPGSFLATIQVGITLAGLLLSAFTADLFVDRLAAVFGPGLPIGRSLSVILITVILSYFSLVFGELVPKRMAQQNPEKMAQAAAGTITFCQKLLKPFVFLLDGSTNLVLRLFKIDPTETDRTVTEEEIRLLLDVGRETGNIHEAEKLMIDRIFEFNDKEVSEIMTHRTGIVSLNVDADYFDVLQVAIHEKYTRIPVYEENIDNIIGVLHIKDLLLHAAEGLKGPFSLRDMIRPPFFIPESKNIDELLREMQHRHVQLAVAIDEYGGTAGIITIEDLLEEIVGNIQDEYDEEESQIERKGDMWIVSGQADLDEVAQAIGVDLPEDDFDTLGGLVFDLLGRIPEEDESPEVTWENMHFQILAMDEKRIAKVGIRLVLPDNSAPAANQE